MGAGGSKTKGSPRFADEFYGKNHKRLAAPLQRHFASGVKYNLKIVIRGDHCTGKSVLLKQLHRFSVTVAKSQSTALGSLWSMAMARPTSGEEAFAPAEREGQPYVPTRQIQVANLTWKYKETDDVIKVEVWDVVDQGIITGSHGGSPIAMVEGVSPLDGAEPPARATNVADAEAIDVYRHCNGVIMLFDVTKARTIEYIGRQLAEVPKELPVLILGNFADRIFDQEIIDFHQRRFLSIRGANRGEGHPENISSFEGAPLHFMLGSLTQANCPHNPQRGLIPAVMKFFELPFLQLQRGLLKTRLKINEEQMKRAQIEWLTVFCEGSGGTDQDNGAVLLQPAVARTSNHNVTSIELLSTDTLTRASTQAWSSPSDIVTGTYNPSTSYYYH